jgi:hypothetical protein
MPSNIIREGSGFRIMRPQPLVTSNGLFGDVDATVKAKLDELNSILARRVFDPQPGQRAGRGLDPAAVLARGVVLTPKRTSGAQWAANSLAATINAENPGQNKDTLADHISKTPALATLKYSFEDLLDDAGTTLPFNARTILGDDYAAIRDYLIAYAYEGQGLQDATGVKNFILNDGVAAVADYASVSAAREIIEKKALKVANYNGDASPVAEDIRQAKLEFLAYSFETQVVKVVEGYVFDDKYERLIKNAAVGKIKPELLPHLIQYVKHSPVEIDQNNINYFLPLFISQASANAVVDDPTPISEEESEKDFDVDFFDDDRSTIQINELAVKCAAQLYYVMVAGDELDVFDVVNYFTHKYLIRGGFEIVDGRLRDDLQTYVFSNRFTDLKTGRVEDRTRPAERHMFYKQVFNEGGAQVSDEMIVNAEFPRLWKVLILESAEYLERAQASLHPDSFVSRQKVMQAVEDLQYNLSTHCTGLANVVTPLINAELNFVIKRFFQHPEVLRQLAPIGGTWWRVVERLCMEMKHVRPKTTVLYNKAKLGHDIIDSIANYNPSTFQGDAEFSQFISAVDAFITTQSILQQALTDDLKRDQEEAPTKTEGETPPGQRELVTAPTATNGKPSSDEWDF